MILNGIIISLLFIVSLTFPLISFILPVYKISKIDRLPLKNILLSNLMACVIIGIFNTELLIPYLFFYIPIEALYIFFEKNKKIKIEKFNRIVVISIVSTILISIFFYLFKDSLNKEIDVLMEVYKKNLGFTSSDITLILTTLKKNGLSYIFDYSILTIYFIFMILDSRFYKTWKISFYWVLLYIIPFFIIRLFNIDNYYLQNILQIGQTIFIFYGIKTTYKLLSKFIKYKFLRDFFSFGFAIIMPFAIFIYGIFGAFWQDKNN